MNSRISLLVLASALLAGSAFAATPPAGSTGVCKDGSYWSGPTKMGACKGHKGVQDWYAATTPTAAPAAAPMTAAPTKPLTSTTAASAMKPAAAAPMVAPKTTSAPMEIGGGGPGQVWVNTKSKVYHCPGTEYYGKTKVGSYMTEAAATAAGNRPDHGKVCH